MNKATTHIRVKTGEKVIVTREGNNTVVVRTTKGEVLGSYDRPDMPKFYKRYTSLVANKGNK